MTRDEVLAIIAERFNEEMNTLRPPVETEEDLQANWEFFFEDELEAAREANESWEDEWSYYQELERCNPRR